MNKRKIEKNPIQIAIIYLFAWLIASGIASAIDNPELFLKGLLHQ